MKNLNIAINTKTKVIKYLETIYNVEYYKQQTLLEKLLLKDKKYPDIYFHQGSLNTTALDMVENSKLTIVNSNSIKETILEKRSYLNENKIFILYPYINATIKYDKKIKKEFRKTHNISKEDRIIYFTAKDLALGGLDKVLEIISQLEKNNFVLLIDTDTLQAHTLKDKLVKLKINDKVIILENYAEKDKLFIAADIFILPTKQKLFAPNVLKAMYYKNAIFVNRDNAASEIIDAFSLIIGQNDQTISFKTDALLENKEELKKIQKENYLVVKNITYDTYIEELNTLIKDNFDF